MYSCKIVYQTLLFDIVIIYYQSKRVWLQMHRNRLGDECRSPSSSEILPTQRHDFIAFWNNFILVRIFLYSVLLLQKRWGAPESTLTAPEKHIVLHSACSGASGSFWKDWCGCSNLRSLRVMTSEPFYISPMWAFRILDSIVLLYIGFNVRTAFVFAVFWIISVPIPVKPIVGMRNAFGCTTLISFKWMTVDFSDLADIEYLS